VAVGANGETLVADSSTSTGLRYNPITGNLNAVINGGFDFWQRGTSSAITSSSATFFLADRWNNYRGATGSTVSRQSSGLTGFLYSARVQRDSGNTSTSLITLQTGLESQQSYALAGKTVTLSFYAKVGANYSATSSILIAQVAQGTGTDQNYVSGFTGQTSVISQNATLTTSWQRFSYTGSVNAASTQLGIAFLFYPTGTAGANDWFEITGVQLEIGSVATTFTRAGGTIQGELAACQRYYWRNTATSAYSNFALGFERTSTDAKIVVFLPNTLRVAPDSVESGGNFQLLNAGGTIAVTSFALDQGNLQAPSLYANIASGGSASRPCQLTAQNSTTAYIAFSAEL
jgi:hypothetical protein